MADADDVRRLALALPGTVEIDSEGFDFRVAGRGFVWSWPERLPGRPRVIRTDVAVLYVGDEAEKQALLLGEPDLFFTAGEYADHPLVLLRLRAVGVGRLAELLTDAWQMRAGDDAVPPANLLASAGLDDVGTGTGAEFDTRTGHEPDVATETGAGPEPDVATEAGADPETGVGPESTADPRTGVASESTADPRSGVASESAVDPGATALEDTVAVREPAAGAVLSLSFAGEIFEWRGPAPYHFVAVPEAGCRAIAAAAARVTYGWGMIPVAGRIGSTSFTTSLWPRQGGYVVPIKVAVQRAESLRLGDTVTIDLDVVPPR